jgi:hypothetical protein
LSTTLLRKLEVATKVPQVPGATQQEQNDNVIYKIAGVTEQSAGQDPSDEPRLRPLEDYQRLLGRTDFMLHRIISPVLEHGADAIRVCLFVTTSGSEWSFALECSAQNQLFTYFPARQSSSGLEVEWKLLKEATERLALTINASGSLVLPDNLSPVKNSMLSLPNLKFGRLSEFITTDLDRLSQADRTWKRINKFTTKLGLTKQTKCLDWEFILTPSLGNQDQSTEITISAEGLYKQKISIPSADACSARPTDAYYSAWQARQRWADRPQPTVDHLMKQSYGCSSVTATWSCPEGDPKSRDFCDSLVINWKDGSSPLTLLDLGEIGLKRLPTKNPVKTESYQLNQQASAQESLEMSKVTIEGDQQMLVLAEAPTRRHQRQARLREPSGPLVKLRSIVDSEGGLPVEFNLTFDRLGLSVGEMKATETHKLGTARFLTTEPLLVGTADSQQSAQSGTVIAKWPRANEQPGWLYFDADGVVDLTLQPAAVWEPTADMADGGQWGFAEPIKLKVDQTNAVRRGKYPLLFTSISNLFGADSEFASGPSLVNVQMQPIDGLSVTLSPQNDVDQSTKISELAGRLGDIVVRDHATLKNETPWEVIKILARAPRHHADLRPWTTSPARPDSILVSEAGQIESREKPKSIPRWLSLWSLLPLGLETLFKTPHSASAKNVALGPLGASGEHSASFSNGKAQLAVDLLSGRTMTAAVNVIGRRVGSDEQGTMIASIVRDLSSTDGVARLRREALVVDLGRPRATHDAAPGCLKAVELRQRRFILNENLLKQAKLIGDFWCVPLADGEVECDVTVVSIDERSGERITTRTTGTVSKPWFEVCLRPEQSADVTKWPSRFAAEASSAVATSSTPGASDPIDQIKVKLTGAVKGTLLDVGVGTDHRLPIGLDPTTALTVARGVYQQSVVAPSEALGRMLSEAKIWLEDCNQQCGNLPAPLAIVRLIATKLPSSDALNQWFTALSQTQIDPAIWIEVRRTLKAADEELARQVRIVTNTIERHIGAKNLWFQRLSDLNSQVTSLKPNEIKRRLLAIVSRPWLSPNPLPPDPDLQELIERLLGGADLTATLTSIIGNRALGLVASLLSEQNEPTIQFNTAYSDERGPSIGDAPVDWIIARAIVSNKTVSESIKEFEQKIKDAKTHFTAEANAFVQSTASNVLRSLDVSNYWSPDVHGHINAAKPLPRRAS